MAGCLGHLRVVDCTDVRGALAARILADLGAEVVKTELDDGDVGRRRGPYAGGVAGPDRAFAFLYRNANKRGAVIDLHDADGVPGAGARLVEYLPALVTGLRAQGYALVPLRELL